MAANSVAYLHNEEEFHQLNSQLAPTGRLLVIDFTASWCGPCRRISPIFETLAQKYSHSVFRKVDVDQAPDLAEYFNVQAMPTFVFLKDGNPIDRLTGANVAELEKKVDQHSSPPNKSTDESARGHQMPGGLSQIRHPTQEDLQVGLGAKSLIENHVGFQFPVYEVHQVASQVVAGTNFFFKIHVGDGRYVHARIFRDLPHNGHRLTCHSVQHEKTYEDPLVYF